MPADSPDDSTPAHPWSALFLGAAVLVSILALGLVAHATDASPGVPVTKAAPTADAPATESRLALDAYDQAGRGIPIRAIIGEVSSSVVPVTAEDPTAGLFRGSAPVGWLAGSAAMESRSGAIVVVVPRGRAWPAGSTVTLESESGLRLVYAADAGAGLRRSPGLIALECPRDARGIETCVPVVRAVAIERGPAPWSVRQ